MESLVQATEQNTAVLAILFFGMLTMLWLFSMAFNPNGAALKRRMRVLAERQDKLRGIREDADRLKRNPSNSPIRKWALAIGKKSPLNKEEKLSEWGAKLGQAGYRHKNAIFEFMAIKMAMLAGLPVAAYLVMVLAVGGAKQFEIILGSVAAGIIGFLLPDYILSKMATGRIARIKKAFPDAVDMLVVCTEAGLGMDAAIKRVSQEIYAGSPDMAEEMAATLVELNFFQHRHEAFNNLAKRIPLSHARTFANTMIQTEKFGTPVSQSLRILSEEFRKDRMADAETKASKLATKILFPIIVFIFMPMLAVIILPAIIQMTENWIN